jgi:MerR family transcriptional regulator/heat shock protein HspR
LKGSDPEPRAGSKRVPATPEGPTTDSPPISEPDPRDRREADAAAPGVDPARGVYAISVAAELVGIDPQSLRLYERRGLLDPARTSGGTRRYSSDDIDRLLRITQLLHEGLNLEADNAHLRASLDEDPQDAEDRDPKDAEDPKYAEDPKDATE